MLNYSKKIRTHWQLLRELAFAKNSVIERNLIDWRMLHSNSILILLGHMNWSSKNFMASQLDHPQEEEVALMILSIIEPWLIKVEARSLMTREVKKLLKLSTTNHLLIITRVRVRTTCVILLRSISAFPVHSRWKIKSTININSLLQQQTLNSKVPWNQIDLNSWCPSVILWSSQCLQVCARSSRLALSS